MKLYKTTSTCGTEPNKIVWSGTQADAASERKKSMDAGNKRSEVTTEDVEVPTDKAGLLAWLNSNCVGE